MTKAEKLKMLQELEKHINERRDFLDARQRRLQVITAKALNATEDISVLEAEMIELGNDIAIATKEKDDFTKRAKEIRADVYHSPFTARG